MARSDTAGIDTTRPNAARVSDYLAGGKNCFAADREEAGRLLEAFPALGQVAGENRAFLSWAAWWAASAYGIAQFADLGCGFPGRPAIHETVRGVIPGARVAYADTDPMVCSHMRALAAGPGIAVIGPGAGSPPGRGDLTDIPRLLADPALTGAIDLGRPVAVILGAVAGYIDAATGRRVCADLGGALAPGSALVLSTAFYAEHLGRTLAGLHTCAPRRNHDPAELARWFDGAGWERVNGNVCRLRQPRGSRDAQLISMIGVKR
jgi:S-adenosyl methyltransferase